MEESEYQAGIIGPKKETHPSSYPSEGSVMGEVPLRGDETPGAFHRARLRRLSEVPVNVPGSEYTPSPYRALENALDSCYAQAAWGKGKQRHTDGGEPIEQQFICRGQRVFGIGGGLFQAGKKCEEAFRLQGRGNTDAALAELRGAINYIAAAIIVLEEGRANGSPSR